MSINALIIEDEPMNAEGLMMILENKHKEISVRGVASTVNSAIESINTLKPDIIFLDIKLPDGDGFDVLKNVGYNEFSTIFTTAYNQFALKAFDFSAIDYLLKPIKESELARAITKVSSLKNFKMEFDNCIPGFEKLPLPTSYGVWFVNLNDILYFEADNNYTTVYLLSGKKYLVCRTLHSIELLLEGKHFLRIHRSFIINVNFINSLIRGKQNLITLENGNEFPIGEQFKKSVKEKLRIF